MSFIEDIENTQAADALSLIQLASLVRAAFARTAEDHQLTPVQARLLCALTEQPRGMAELARGFGVEKAALTGLVDRAEARGLVKRIPVPGDRRALHVGLTDVGRQSATAFHAAVTDELDALLSPLTARQRQEFREVMSLITPGTISTSEMGTCERSDSGVVDPALGDC